MIWKIKQNRRTWARSRGYTLVELLVGMFISLFMIGAAITYMVSSASMFRLQTNDAFSTDNARFLMEYLARHIRRAGQNSSRDPNVIVDGIYTGRRCADAADTANKNGDGEACSIDQLDGISDRFAVDFVITENERACNGEELVVPAGGYLRIANVFWVGDLDDDGVRSLYCQPLNVTTDAFVGSAVPIIDGVDAIQAQYGVDLLGVDPGVTGQGGVVNAYWSYSNLISARPQNPRYMTNRVVTLRLAMLVNSGVVQAEDSFSDVPKDKTYQLLDAPAITFDADRTLRQIYSTTILLPNGQFFDQE